MRDSGLQPERTVLAWRRTASSFVVAAVLAARLLMPSLGGWALLAGVVVAVAVVVIVAAALRRRLPHGPGPINPDSVRPAPAWLAAVAVATVVAGTAAAWACF